MCHVAVTECTGVSSVVLFLFEYKFIFIIINLLFFVIFSVNYTYIWIFRVILSEIVNCNDFQLTSWLFYFNAGLLFLVFNKDHVC